MKLNNLREKIRKQRSYSISFENMHVQEQAASCYMTMAAFCWQYQSLTSGDTYTYFACVFQVVIYLLNAMPAFIAIIFCGHLGTTELNAVALAVSVS